MSKLIFIYGLHAVKARLELHPETVDRIYAVKNDQKTLAFIELAKQSNIRIEYVSREQLTKLTHSDHHQGVAASTTKVLSYNENDLPALIEQTELPFFLVLDGVQDPHNLGACLRTADAAGVTAVIAPKDKSVGLTGVVSKVASGAAEIVPFIQVTNLARTLKLMKDSGVWLYGGAGEATRTIYQENFKCPVGLVMGAEGSGLRRLTREHCDGLVKIPMVGTVESLNISVAAGVMMFEVVRQRLV